MNLRMSLAGSRDRGANCLKNANEELTWLTPCRSSKDNRIAADKLAAEQEAERAVKLPALTDQDVLRVAKKNIVPIT